MSTAALNFPVSKVSASNDEAEILGILETLRQAHHDHNAALFAAQFAPNAEIYNLAPPLAHHGVDLAEKQAWLDSWATPVEIDTRDFKVTINGDFAFCHGYMHMRGTKKGAGYEVNFWMRETLCLERQGSRWQIVHEHTSVPFYMDGSLRPAFDLQP
jgi:ketosteroid isomerase-like protein